VVWWVAYRRDSFVLKERYTNAQHAHARCDGLFTTTQFLRIVPSDDAEGLASLAHCFELPPPLSSSV
jgi:hypothetical protein